MHRRTILAIGCLALAVCGSGLQAAWEVQGWVVDRDGAGVSYCRLDFYVDEADEEEAPRYSVTTNADGVFYLTDPSYGVYYVVVSKHDYQWEFEAQIDSEGLTPESFQVDL